MEWRWFRLTAGGGSGGGEAEDGGVGCDGEERRLVVMMKRVAGCGWRRKWWRCGGEMVADEMVMDIRWWCDVDGGVVVVRGMVADSSFYTRIK
ncbi:hypothetical protein Tco_0048953 [Tanacetum coccineum]